MESTINIMSLNVGMTTNFAALTTLLSDIATDVILLQEVRVSNEHLNCVLGPLGYNLK